MYAKKRSFPDARMLERRSHQFLASGKIRKPNISIKILFRDPPENMFISFKGTFLTMKDSNPY
jgi:hypothetical protein